MLPKFLESRRPGLSSSKGSKGLIFKAGLFPLVVTRGDKPPYIQALEEADHENLQPLVDLIVKLQIIQFTKSTAIPQSLLVEKDVDTAAESLLKAAEMISPDRLGRLQDVFAFAHAIEDEIAK